MDERIKYRHEYKYLLDMSGYIFLKNTLSPLMAQDRHVDQDGCYRIRSLYFDDRDDTDFFAKLSGLYSRKKYRIRYYNFDESYIVFEKKIKEGSGSFKRSARLSAEQARQAACGHLTQLVYAKSPLLREIGLAATLRGLKPSVITDYIREPLIEELGNVRVTFDRRISTCLTNTDIFEKDIPLLPAIGAGDIILEVKYDSYLPTYIAHALSRAKALQMAISKYALCRRYIAYNDWEVL